MNGLSFTSSVNMRVFPVVLFVFTLAKSLSAAPATAAAAAVRGESDPELTAGYFQGDIILSQHERNGMTDETYRWPDRTVYYFINSYIGEISMM